MGKVSQLIALTHCFSFFFCVFICVMKGGGELVGV